MEQIVLNGNNIDLLKNYPDNFFDAVITDPPYGLGKEPNAEELMKDWIEKGYHEVGGTGFMGKEWDAFVPQPIFWKEVFRVLKHGGHVVSFFGTRTYDWGVMAMRFAGFEVRDCIQWLYGSGFPKSHNISKAIDKMVGAEREVVGVIKGMGKQNSEWNGTAKGRKQDSFKSEFELTEPYTDNAKKWDGWGSALKPANEPIVLARKPLEKGLSIAENVLKWGTGGINIDGCRVATDDLDAKSQLRALSKNSTATNGKGGVFSGSVFGEPIDSFKNNTFNPFKGRFPANLILTHHPECECVGMKKVKGTRSGKMNTIVGETSNGVISSFRRGEFVDITDENGEETIEDWECHEDCPIKIMDEQSGVIKTGDIKPYSQKNIDSYSGSMPPIRDVNFKGDTGGASRFFYCAKSSKSERNKGLEGFEEKPLAFSNQAKAELKRGNLEFNGNGITGDGIVGHGNKINMIKNFHPTVKPIKLMQYLARLITPPNGIVLDPFCGSGTTGIACKLEGFEFVGMEQDVEYTKIAQARIENYKDEKEEVKQREAKKDQTPNDELNQLTLF